MEMVGPGDMERLLETCRNIVIENNTNSDTNGDAVSQSYETFLYSTITDVSVMQPATLDHYVVMEPDELEQLRTAFEEMDSEATVVMIRTRMPYIREGIIFKFSAVKIATMRQVQEMMTTSMVSEGEDIASKMDAVYRETSLPGSQYGLGSSAMLHHECRHMAAHLGAADNKSPTKENMPERTALRQVDEVTREVDQTLAEDASSHGTKYVTGCTTL